jgi:rhodanese-related sulfurtransferase
MTLKQVSPAEASTLMAEGYRYIDVRTEAEYAMGHPKGALNVPFMLATPDGMRPNPDFNQVMNATFQTSDKLIIGCKSGGRSRKASEALLALGFENIVDQRAGFEGVRNAFGKLTEPGWHPAGLAIESNTVGGSYVEIKAAKK